MDTHIGTLDREGFVLSHAELHAPALVPEISLYLASEIMTLWGETEAAEAAQASRLGVLPPPYWAFAWAGGQALARYVLDHPEEVAGKAVLDFGTGSGLVAIAAACAGAAHVTAAELDPIALAAAGLNAAANGVSGVSPTQRNSSTPNAVSRSSASSTSHQKGRCPNQP